MAAKGYLFDTVMCSRWRRGDRANKQHVDGLPPDATLYTSIISVGELLLGIHKAPAEHQEKLALLTREILARFADVLLLRYEVAENYGEIVAKMNPGWHIGQNDYWIAAIAMTHDLTLVTSDPDFERIEGLSRENWLV